MQSICLDLQLFDHIVARGLRHVVVTEMHRDELRLSSLTGKLHAVGNELGTFPQIHTGQVQVAQVLADLYVLAEVIDEDIGMLGSAHLVLLATHIDIAEIQKF